MKKLKNVFLLGVGFLLSINGFSQNVREVATKINKAEQKGIAADYAYPDSYVSQALSEKFKLANFGKSKSKSGFSVYSAVTWAEVAPSDKLDVYVKTSESKGNTSVIILLSRGYDNFMNATNDPQQMENLKTFLTNILTDIETVALTKKIEAQLKVVKDAEDKAKSIQKDYESLKGQKEKIEKNMEQNLEAQKKAQSDIDAANAVLNELKAKLQK